MTPSEFKAWFDGFTEALEGAPTESQLARIKARVAEINGVAISYPVYIDRYRPSYPWNWYYGTPYQQYGNYGVSLNGTTGPSGMMSGASNTAGMTGMLQGQNLACQNVSGQNFNSIEAMYAAGRDEASEMN